jgi:hypothetical protein
MGENGAALFAVPDTVYDCGVETALGAGVGGVGISAYLKRVCIPWFKAAENAAPSAPSKL